ncbi:MAG TPA: glycosyltransferase [Bryobacteraceae bacterium]|nr:glycosyltransferase [Bryobacteraceae bacterium]
MTDILVSCIMPTYDRRAFIPRALAYFARQDYPNRELIVVDDGTDCIQDLIPVTPEIRYYRLPSRTSLGRKRNFACEQARGQLIAHWDDDDWYSPSRLRECVQTLAASGRPICGVAVPYFLDPVNRRSWRFHYTNSQSLWVAGSSLCYRRDYWMNHRFSEINVGEDTHFVFDARPGDAAALPDSSTFVALIHPQNSSPKHVQSTNWKVCPFEELTHVMKDDLALYGLPAPGAGAVSSGPMVVARARDLELPEYAAFPHSTALPWMRRWELPFALFQSRLPNTPSILDCTINPCGFSDWLAKLYPHALYRHVSPLAQGAFTLPFGVPDESFDRAICVNTLEHLVVDQRARLIGSMARKLKPGGVLTLTSDYYFDSAWQNSAFLNAGVMRRDRSEFLNGWNKVTPEELIRLCQSFGLALITGEPGHGGPMEGDSALFTQQAPFRHACIAGVFQKVGGSVTAPSKKIVLALLTWNTRDISIESVRAYLREASMLTRLGHRPFICVVDNGSADGTPEALRALETEMGVPYKFLYNRENLGNSVARNQILDYVRECDADYVLFMDGDIEIVPFSSFAMMRYMENCGRQLGCIGADSGGQTPNRPSASPYLFSISGLQLQTVNLVAWTQYGMFRREVFEDGVRFDEADPFRGPGWGFEDNDLAFQMDMKGYLNQRFYGMVYLHRAMCSSIRIMRGMGIDASALYQRRKQYTISKWAAIPRIASGPLLDVRRVELRL